MSAEQSDPNKKNSPVVNAFEKIVAPIKQKLLDTLLSKEADRIRRNITRSDESQACDHKTMTLYISA